MPPTNEGAVSYDLAGNLEFIRHSAPSRTWKTEIWTSETSNRSLPKHRLDGLELPNPQQFFDENGNTLALPHLQTLEWDWDNRLRRAVIVDRADTSEEDDAEHYVYGADGVRVRKVTERLVGGRMEVRDVIYLPGCEIVEVRHGPAMPLRRRTSYVSDVSSTVATLHQWDVDDRARETEHIDRKKLRYRIDDRLGSAVLELGPEGEVVSYEEYFPYGGTSFIAGESARDVKLKEYRYSGKLRDDSTGLYYYEYRYYAPFIGNWLSPDPLGPVDGLNLYRFVRNNPMRFVDPDGLESGEPKDEDIVRGPITGSVDVPDRIREKLSDPGAGDIIRPYIEKHFPGETAKWHSDVGEWVKVEPEGGSGGSAEADLGSGEDSEGSDADSVDEEGEDDGGASAGGDGGDAAQSGEGAPGASDEEGTESSPGKADGTDDAASHGDGAGLEGTGKGGGGDSENTAGRAEEGEGLGAGGENVEPGGKGKGGTADKRQKGAKDGKEDAGESDGDRVSGEGTSQDGPADSSGSAKDAIDVPIPPWLEPHSEGLQYSTELTLTPFYDAEGPEGAEEVDPRAWPGGDVGSALRPGGHESGTRTYGEADALGDVGSGKGSGHKLRPGVSDGSSHGTETPSDWDLWVERNTAWLDAVQTSLDAIGLLPVIGEWADALSGVVSLVRGDFVGAALSFAAMVPVVGVAFTGGKKARKVAGASDELAAAGKYGDEAAGGGQFRHITRKSVSEAVDIRTGASVEVPFKDLSSGAARLVRKMQNNERVLVGGGVLVDDLRTASVFMGVELGAIVDNSGRLMVVRGSTDRLPFLWDDVMLVHTHPRFSSDAVDFTMDVATAGSRVEAVIDWAGNITHFNNTGILPDPGSSPISALGYITGRLHEVL